MYDAHKQSKNGIVVSYKHIVPENKIIKIGIRKNDTFSLEMEIKERKKIDRKYSNITKQKLKKKKENV